MTAFGAIYSTNITPDPQTGIGLWSAVAFLRAMREGVDREGHRLYPAFPYDHFTLVTDADDAALYAFLMTRRSVRAPDHENRLQFPFNSRALLAAWNLLFLRDGPYRPDATHDPQWNRGAYLARGLGHCGACHSSRNALGAERSASDFDGGTSEGWRAYALDATAPASVPWSSSSLYQYMRDGWHPQHGGAHGPMATVLEGLQTLPDQDLEAIAVYVASLESNGAGRGMAPRPNPTGHAVNPGNGADIYAAACASCHDGSRPLPLGGVPLALSSATTDESATNLVNVVLAGLQPLEGTPGAVMPSFATALTDSQLESLATFIRRRFAAKPPWPDVAARAREARGRTDD